MFNLKKEFKMTIDYILLTAIVGALYLAVKQWLPDFPVSGEVFQVVIAYLLVKIGVTIINKPAAAIRKLLFK